MTSPTPASAPAPMPDGAPLLPAIGGRGRALLALGAGAAGALGFAPLGWWPLMLASLLVLLLLIESSARLRQAAWLGWLYGVGQFVVGLNWIAGSFRFQEAMPVWLGWVAVVLLSLYLALYPMIAALIGWTQRRSRLGIVLALTAGWAIGEWLRGWVLTGFAWNPVGVVLIDTPWRAAAGAVGTYGLGMIAVLLAGTAYLLLARRWLKAGLVTALALAPLLVPRPAPAEAPAERQLRLVQPGIGQADKYRPDFAAVAEQRFTTLSRPATDRATLILWPEAAITEPLVDPRPEASDAVADRLLGATATLRPADRLLTGGLGLLSDDGPELSGATNSIYLLGPRGQRLGGYDKAHLVPFGEYLPWRATLSRIGLERLVPGALDFIPGPGPTTIDAGGWGRVGLSLCYEIIFPGRIVDRADRPQWIYNPSNDAWFGAWGPPQHLAQARLRAAEEGLPVVRTTPTGISALIDADGALLATIGSGVTAGRDGALPPPRRPTLFAEIGNTLPLALAALALLVAIALPRMRR